MAKKRKNVPPPTIEAEADDLARAVGRYEQEQMQRRLLRNASARKPMHYSDAEEHNNPWLEDAIRDLEDGGQ